MHLALGREGLRRSGNPLSADGRLNLLTNTSAPLILPGRSRQREYQTYWKWENQWPMKSEVVKHMSLNMSIRRQILPSRSVSQSYKNPLPAANDNGINAAGRTGGASTTCFFMTMKFPCTRPPQRHPSWLQSAARQSPEAQIPFDGRGPVARRRRAPRRARGSRACRDRWARGGIDGSSEPVLGLVRRLLVVSAAPSVGP